MENSQYIEEIKDFLSVVADDIKKEEGADVVNSAFSPVLAIVQDQLENSSILTYNQVLLNVLYAYATIPSLAIVSTLSSLTIVVKYKYLEFFIVGMFSTMLLLSDKKILVQKHIQLKTLYCKIRS